MGGFLAEPETTRTAGLVGDPFPSTAMTEDFQNADWSFRGKSYLVMESLIHSSISESFVHRPWGYEYSFEKNRLVGGRQIKRWLGH